MTRHCDFCYADGPPWSYLANDIRLIVGNSADDYDPLWMACDDCADLVDARDLNALIDLAVRAHRVHGSPAPAGIDAEGWERLVRQHVTALLAAFMANQASGRSPVVAA